MAKKPKAKKPARYLVTDGEMMLELEPAEGGRYTATSPFIEGLVTEGKTLEEVFEMARDAAAGLEAVRKKLARRKRKRSPRRAR